MVMPVCASSIEDHMTEMKIDDGNKVIVIYMDDEFAEQKLTEKSVKKIYKKTRKKLKKALPPQYAYYDVRIMLLGTPIENLVKAKEETAEKEKKEKKHHKPWRMVGRHQLRWRALGNQHITSQQGDGWTERPPYSPMAEPRQIL